MDLLRGCRVVSERAEDYLLERETENCLMLGISGQLARHPESVRHEPYLAIIEDGGVAAAALVTPPYKLILSFGTGPEAASVIAGDLHQAYPELPGVLAGELVSMTGHRSPTPNGIRINTVYTPPPLRQRRYATSWVAALTGEGRGCCFLFTDFINPTSNSYTGASATSRSAM